MAKTSTSRWEKQIDEHTTIMTLSEKMSGDTNTQNMSYMKAELSSTVETYLHPVKYIQRWILSQYLSNAVQTPTLANPDQYLTYSSHIITKKYHQRWAVRNAETNLDIR